jgi:hypothetical protein
MANSTKNVFLVPFLSLFLFLFPTCYFAQCRLKTRLIPAMRVSSLSEENASLLGEQEDTAQHRNYNTTTAKSDYNWNVEIDVKGQVNTGPEEENNKFSLSKLIKYTGPGNVYRMASHRFLIS